MTSIGSIGGSSSETDQAPAEAPHRAMCSLCDRAPAARRGVCWSCYAKFRECKLPLPDREPPGRPPTPALRRWLLRFDVATLIQLHVWIETLLAEGRE